MGTILRVNAVGALLVAGLFWLLPPDSPVADAAARGDIETVRSLVKQGADVNAAQGDGMTALHWAAEEGSLELAEVLIYAGARVDALTRLGSYTPLHLASQRGHAAVMKALLAAGADANAPTTTGAVRPLHFAAESGSVEAVHALVDGGADVNGAEQQWGQTPLMFAAAKNRAAAITALLQRGADPEITGTVIDMIEWELQDRARKRRRDEIVEAVGLPPGFNPARLAGIESVEVTEADKPGPRGNYTLRSAEEVGGYGGLTALTLAARQGHVEAAMALLDGGADIDMPSKGDNTGPLLIATINGHFDLAMLLLERGADPHQASDAGNRPLFATISRRWMPDTRPPGPTDYLRQKTTYLEVMEVLLEAGADVNARLNYSIWHLDLEDRLQVDWAGATAFFRAAHGFDVAAMKLLVRYGADPNIPTIRPSYFRRDEQVARDNPEVVELPKEWSDEIVDPSGLPMIPQGGPGFYPINAASGISHQSGRQGTAHRYVPNGWLPAVKYLIEELGADPSQRDHNGDTPLHNTAFRGDNELILYLVSKGADPLVVNRNGQTTVDKANGPIQRIEPFPETVKVLEDLGAKNNHNCVSC